MDAFPEDNLNERVPPRSSRIFSAILGEETQQALELESRTLFQMCDTLGSPLNIVFAYTFQKNVKAATEVFNGVGVSGRVLYAAKANRSRCFFKMCGSEAIGVDVSSLQELEAALACGVSGELCSASGPFKNSAFLNLALQVGALITIDSIDELRQLQQMEPPHGKIMLRWTGISQNSRFGMADAEIAECSEQLKRQPGYLAVKGLSFHLGGYSTTQRSEHILVGAKILDKLREIWPDADTMNIGGGLPIGYLSQLDWERFQRTSLGSSEFAKTKTPAALYPHWSPACGADALRDILTYRKDGRSVACHLAEKGISILVEPGRALLDQAGMTVFSVSGVRRHVSEPVAVVDGLSLSMSEVWFGGDIAFDPIIIPNNRIGRVSKEISCYVAGASCYEDDVLTWRRIVFGKGLDEGDLMIFPNTAGYLMDMIESRFHLRPLPERVAVDARHRGSMRWKLDDRFAVE